MSIDRIAAAIIPLFPGCGGSIEGSSGVIESPGYPNGYPHHHLCSWVITGPVGRAVKLEFEDFDLEPARTYTSGNRTFTYCPYDYLYVSAESQVCCCVHVDVCLSLYFVSSLHNQRELPLAFQMCLFSYSICCETQEACLVFWKNTKVLPALQFFPGVMRENSRLAPGHMCLDESLLWNCISLSCLCKKRSIILAFKASRT